MRNIFYTIGYNTFAQLLGKAVSTVLAFVSVGLLTRYLGQEGFGNYSLVFAYLSIFGILADFGLQLTMVRELAKENKKNSAIYGTYLWLKIILVILSTLLAYFFLIFFPYSQFLKIAIVITSFGFALGALNNYGMVIFQANLRLDLLTLVDVATKIATVGLIALFVFLKSGFYSILNTVLIGNLVGSLLIVIILKKFIIFNFQFDFSLAKKIIRKSLPVGLISILAFLYFKIDTLILSIFRNPSEIGIYSLAYKIIENLLVLWGFYMATVYPLLSKFLGEKKDHQAKVLWQKSLVLAVFSGIFVLFAGWILAPLAIRILGGVEFKESILALRILLLGLPLFFLNNLFYHTFLAKEKIVPILLAISTSLVFNLILNLTLIPRWGYLAAAFNTVITEGYLLSFYLIKCKS